MGTVTTKDGTEILRPDLPVPNNGARSVKLLKHGTLKSYPGLPHRMPTTHADQINADLLTFIRS